MSSQKDEKRPDAPAPFNLELAPPDLASAEREAGLTGRAQRFYRAGHRLLARGFFAEAAEAFEYATRHDRSYYDAYVGMSEALVLTGEVKRAAAELELAMERFGRNCALGAARGHVYLHEQNPDKAIECATIATQYDPEYAYAWIVAGEARLSVGGTTGEYAAESFATAQRATVTWPHLALRIALAHAEWHDAEGASPLLREVLEAEPGLPLAWILSGDVARLEDDRKRADRCYRRACELAPGLHWLRESLSWRGRAIARLRDMQRRAVGFFTQSNETVKD